MITILLCAFAIAMFMTREPPAILSGVSIITIVILANLPY